MAIIIPGISNSAQLIVGDRLISALGRNLSEINYILNGDFETGQITGWATYADAAGTVPVDGTGGASNISFVPSSLGGTAPLRGVYSGYVAKNNVNAQGSGVSYNFTIDRVDSGKPLSISFDFLDISLTPNILAGDFVVYVYDVTNSLLITPSSVSIPGGGGTFRASFVTSSSTSYRLIVHCATTTTNIFNFYLDNIRVGPQPQLSGFPGTKWQSYTPTTAGLGTVTLQDAQWRRVGDSVEVDVRMVSGTPDATTASVSLPPGLIVDPTKLVISRNVGSYSRQATTPSAGAMLASPSGTTLNFSVTTAGLSAAPGNGFVGTAEPFAFFASVPISTWDSNVTMADRAVEEYAWNSDTSDADTLASGFSNGATGVQFGSFSTATRIKRVRFQTPVQATDTVIMEVLDGGGWVPIVDSFAVCLSATTGSLIRAVAGSTTDVDVFFGSAGYPATPRAAAGAWSGVAGSNSFKWRLRKISSGAAIGGAIGARNVVGDTSGTAVPTGYIGERLTTVNTTASNAVANTPYSSGTVSLTPGTYDLWGQMALVTFGSLSGSTDIRIAVRDAAATSFSGTNAGDNLMVFAVSSGGAAAYVGPWRVNVTTTTTYHAVGQIGASSGTGTANLRVIANRVA